MKCPLKQKTFTTEPECITECAWYNHEDEECYIITGVKGNRIGLRTISDYDSITDGAIIRDIKCSGGRGSGGDGGDNPQGTGKGGAERKGEWPYDGIRFTADF